LFSTSGTKEGIPSRLKYCERNLIAKIVIPH
jgi:hypothetical protein